MTIYYKIKAAFRWLMFKISSKDYHAYSSGNVGGYTGWYEAFGRCIAFQRDDDTVQFVW